MGRRRTHVEVSMFPFLSVLCTVIGVLVLFIVLIMSTRVLQQDELHQKVEAHERRPQPGSPDAVEQGIDPATYSALEAELASLHTLLKQRTAEREHLARKLTSLEDLLQFKSTQQLIPHEPTRGRELVKPEPVVLVEAKDGVPADGFQVRLFPILVECGLNEYTMYPSRETFPVITRSKEEEVELCPKLRKFLSDVARRSKREYLLFLIHPNGVEAFDSIRLYVRKNHSDIRVGWEPFSREWIVVNDEIRAMIERQQGAESAPDG